MPANPVALLRDRLGAVVIRSAVGEMPDAAAGVVERAGRPDYGTWIAHAASAGGCVRPVRLRGQAASADTRTGELRPVFDTADLPDGVIYKACGDRRASVCPPCARTYRADTYQLIRAGLAGGKGVPESVTVHPAVFLTLTAPSFGLVHVRRTGPAGRVLPCRRRRRAMLCPHGVDIRCDRTHAEDESALGLPFCLDCYDHAGQVVWNASVGELWRRTVINVRRALRRTARDRRTAPVRLSYAKVAEFQRRGVVHLHALLRLDGVDLLDPVAIVPPPAGLGVAVLEDAIRRAVDTTAFTTRPHRARPDGWQISWGAQLDLRPMRVPASGEITDTAVVAYLAKYATKSTEATGHVSARLNGATVDLYADATTHAGRLVRACWTLGADRRHAGLRRWAHTLGFGGHFSTKSRRYSTTLRTLRAARAAWRRRDAVTARDHAGEAETTLIVGAFTYAGVGWRTTGDALLAQTAAAKARERRHVAREEIRQSEGRTQQ